MMRCAELSREVFEGMEGINPKYAVRVRPLAAFAEIPDRP